MIDVRGDFETACQKPEMEELERLRHDYFIHAKIYGSDDASIGGLNISKSGRRNDLTGKKSKTNTIDDLLFMSLLDQLDAMEAGFVKKYSEDFAENWAAEYLDEETYTELMLIADQEKRRDAIADELNKRIEDGRINFSELSHNPDLHDWLSVHRQIREHASEQAYLGEASEHKLYSTSSEEVALDSLFSKTHQP